MSLLKPILRPTLRSTLSSITSAIRRYFTDFDPVSQTYVQLSSPIVLAGDFEWSMDFWVPDNTTERTLAGNSVDFSYISLRDDGAIRFRGDNDLISQTAPNIYQGGVLNTLKIVKTSTTLEILLNGVTVLTNSNSSNFELEYLGRYKSNSFFFDGILANVRAVQSGTLVLDMPLDGRDYESSAIVSNKQTALGANLYPPDFITGNFNDNGDGSYTKASGGSGELRRTGLGITNGDAYLVQGFVENLGGGIGSLTIQAGGAPTDGRATATISQNGFFSVIVVVETDTLDALRVIGVPDVAFTISGITWQKIPAATPLGTAFNFAAADTELYTLQNGAWVSETKTIPVA